MKILNFQAFHFNKLKMKDITMNEMKAVLEIVKSPEVMYNANNLAKVLKITSMGSLKILKRLEKEGVLKSKQIGKSFVYRVNYENKYACKYVSLVLSREAIQASSTVKRWINEVRKVQNGDIAMLFGSVLNKKEPNDIDVLFVTDQKRFKKLKQEVEKINQMNVKKLHPMYQSFDDVVKNVQRRDKPLLNAIKGVIVFGEDKFLEVYNESRKE